MSIKKSIKTLIIFSTFLVLPVAVFAAVPQLPHIFYGDITINGNPAPVGTVVIANINGVEKGRITTTVAGKYGGPGAYDQKLLVQGDISGSPEIIFTVSDVGASQTAQFESGKVEKLDLAFTITSTPTPTPTPTPAPGGGGGPTTGGGTVLGTSTSKGDSNNDGKVDILDFNILMINWGRTGPNIPGDFNGDGTVDILDFNLLMVNWTG
jgi:hypothetical protein